MNRDDSAEAKKEEKKEEKAPIKEVSTLSNIDMATRMRITKRAKRFQRYGLIQDGQGLVDLVADIAGGLEGKATSKLHVRRHKKDAS